MYRPSPLAAQTLSRDFDTPAERLEGARVLMRALVGIAEKKGK